MERGKWSADFQAKRESRMKEGKIPFAEIFEELKEKYPFKPVHLANLADVNEIVIRWMLTEQPVAGWQAEQVLKMLALVTREEYSLDTVEVVLRPET
jgi:hypothetical protein